MAQPVKMPLLTAKAPLKMGWVVGWVRFTFVGKTGTKIAFHNRKKDY